MFVCGNEFTPHPWDTTGLYYDNRFKVWMYISKINPLPCQNFVANKQEKFTKPCFLNSLALSCYFEKLSFPLKLCTVFKNYYNQPLKREQ